jgi:hypothetical protein
MGMLNSYRDFCPTPMLPKHHFMTSPAPEPRVVIPSPGRHIFIGPSKSARRARTPGSLSSSSSPKTLSPAQQKYGAYDRELLDIYEAITQFCHTLESRHFIIFTDQKLITYAL